MTTSEDLRRERFERLFRDTRTAILAYFLRRTAGPEDAADAVANTYLIAWTKLQVIPDDDQARLWLFGVARNVLLKGASRGRSHQALVARLAAELRRSASQPSAVSDEDADRLREALLRCKEIDREIVTLIAWDGLTPAEVARILNLSPNTVRVRLHRARSRLQRELMGEVQQDPPASWPPGGIRRVGVPPG